MGYILHEAASGCTPEQLVERLAGQPGVMVLRSSRVDGAQGRYSWVTADPFLRFVSHGARCEVIGARANEAPCVFGNPWRVLDNLLARFELLDQLDSPFPLGGCFGFWGYDLKHFVEPRLPRRAVDDLELPDCAVGFYDSLVSFDHWLGKTWVISTGFQADGSRDARRADERRDFWLRALAAGESASEAVAPMGESRPWISNYTRNGFLRAVEQAQRYIRQGHIYQVNLAQRLEVQGAIDAWELYKRLAAVSPAPFAGFYDAGTFQIASSSPESFLRLSGNHIVTRPIKGTRPRSNDPLRDAQLTYELQTSAKEMSELVMITDLLRNDLGRICEFGSVLVPELVRLERFAQVQHLVSTVEGRLRPEVTHLAALASSFPGGSVTGAPKIRAMEIIDELEPVTRGPYTGSLGYLGFNRESQMNILIRSAICLRDRVYFHVGAGIVADSDPAAEYDETLAKAQGFFRALEVVPTPRSHPGTRRAG